MHFTSISTITKKRQGSKEPCRNQSAALRRGHRRLRLPVARPTRLIDKAIRARKPLRYEPCAARCGAGIRKMFPAARRRIQDHPDFVGGIIRHMIPAPCAGPGNSHQSLPAQPFTLSRMVLLPRPACVGEARRLTRTLAQTELISHRASVGMGLAIISL